MKRFSARFVARHSLDERRVLHHLMAVETPAPCAAGEAGGGIGGFLSAEYGSPERCWVRR